MGTIAQSSAPGVPDPGVWSALKLLLAASEVARSAKRDLWEFAVEVNQFLAAGVTHTDLRWLVSKGYARHALEHFKFRSRKRVFLLFKSLAFPAGTCFVLTEKGRRLATLGTHDAATSRDPIGTDETAAGQQAAAWHPRWDGVMRRLCWRNLLVKEFRVPALNQETILAVLEEEGWPPRIDDPLPQAPDQDPKIRLHDAIKGLNRRHLHRVLCFRGDGTGHGIRWQLLGAAAQHAPPDRPHIAP